MSQIAKEFFRDWIADNLDPDKSPQAHFDALLQDADDEGISEEEMVKAVGGDLLRAVSKAIARAKQD